MNKRQSQYEYYLKNKEKIDEQHRVRRVIRGESYKKGRREYHKKWYQKNKVNKDAKSREWAKNHKGRMVEIVQKYTRNNKEKVASYGKRFDQTFEGKYRLLKHRHDKRWKENVIEFQAFKLLASINCSYCGEYTNKGIDRVENDKGYTKQNSAPCCKICNYMKRTMTKEEFLEHIEKIYKFQNLL